MAQYELVREVGESLANVVRLEAGRQKVKVELLCVPPDRAFYDARGAAVTVYLHGMRRDTSDQPNDREEDVEVDGDIFTLVHPPTMQLELHYAVAARAANAVEEQLLLVLAMKAFHEYPTLADAVRIGKNFDEEVSIDPDGSFDEAARTALAGPGVGHHLMAGYRVRVGIVAERELRRRRKVETRVMEIFDKNRAPPGKGEGADRTRASKPGAVPGRK